MHVGEAVGPARSPTRDNASKPAPLLQPNHAGAALSLSTNICIEPCNGLYLRCCIVFAAVLAPAA
jgi:hypothetical protein